MRQFDVGDFVYLQRQLNDILNTSFGRTILRIKAIRPSGHTILNIKAIRPSDRTILKIKAIRPLSVLELQGANECTIWDHSKNCAPCHLSNLDPTIIMLIWIPPLDYPCQVCQRIDDVD